MRLYDQYFRELCFLILLFFVVILISHCGPAVRDKEVYEAEVDFVEAAAAEQVERGIALINKACRCETVMGQRGFTTVECQELAQTILVVKNRMSYHTAFMRYLGGISEERPPQEPPTVPMVNVLCPEDPPPVPDEATVYGENE